jgi:hypothetical protein
MKQLSLALLLATIITFFISDQSIAQERSYTEGSVWNISLIKTKAPYFDDYMNDLNNGWKKVMDEAKKQGIILSYMVLTQSAKDNEDWDLALLIEYKNMAAFDGLREKMEKIQTSLFGSQETRKDSAVKRNELREMLGSKIARQLLFK